MCTCNRTNRHILSPSLQPRYYDIALDHHKADSDNHAAAEILMRYTADGVEVDEYLRTWRMKY